MELSPRQHRALQEICDAFCPSANKLCTCPERFASSAWRFCSASRWALSRSRSSSAWRWPVSTTSVRYSLPASW